MLKGIANLASILKQAQSMGARMEELSEKLRNERITGSAGGQLVTVHTDGLGQVLSVEFDSQLSTSEDLDLIRDLLPAAINDAMTKSKLRHADEMKKLAGGLDLPGLSDMMKPFIGPGE